MKKKNEFFDEFVPASEEVVNEEPEFVIEEPQFQLVWKEPRNGLILAKDATETYWVLDAADKAEPFAPVALKERINAVLPTSAQIEEWFWKSQAVITKEEGDKLTDKRLLALVIEMLERFK